MGYRKGGRKDLFLHKEPDFRQPALDTGDLGSPQAVDGAANRIFFDWGPVESHESGLRKTAVTIRSPVIQRAMDVTIDASPECLLVAAYGAEAIRINCPFQVDVK